VVFAGGGGGIPECTCHRPSHHPVAALWPGMDRAKMKRLLHEAFSHLDPVASSEKINKRLELFS